MSTMAGDPKVGGASSGLVVHNRDENVVTRLSSTVYWCELYISRSLSGAAGSSDCQSGPCAAFRVSAIRPLLVPWYNQRIFGKRMVSSEPHLARRGLPCLDENSLTIDPCIDH